MNNTLGTKVITCNPGMREIFTCQESWMQIPIISSTSTMAEELNELLNTVLLHAPNDEVPEFKVHYNHISHLVRLILVELMYDPDGTSIELGNVLRYEHDITQTLILAFNRFMLDQRLQAYVELGLSNVLRTCGNSSETCVQYWMVVWMVKMLIPAYANAVAERYMKTNHMVKNSAFIHLFSKFISDVVPVGWNHMTSTILSFYQTHALKVSFADCLAEFVVNHLAALSMKRLLEGDVSQHCPNAVMNMTCITYVTQPVMTETGFKW